MQFFKSLKIITVPRLKNHPDRIRRTVSHMDKRTNSDGHTGTSGQSPQLDHGTKISVDSASMMNKALEIIEAHYLFDIPANQIDVLIHPQSIIHSMVEYTDGSVLAQLGAPDMRTLIAYALAYPDRMTTTEKPLIGQHFQNWIPTTRLQPISVPRLGLWLFEVRTISLHCPECRKWNCRRKFLNKEISLRTNYSNTGKIHPSRTRQNSILPRRYHRSQSGNKNPFPSMSD